MKLGPVVPFLFLFLGGFASAVSLGCGGDDETPAAAPDARAAQDSKFAEAARATVKGYAKVGRTVNDEAVRLAKLMEKAIEDFIKAPSPELLEGAKVAWRTARDAYGRAEAFRFTGSPLDEDAELAKRVEIAPVDVTLLEGPTLDAGGILDDLMLVPDVTGDAVRDAVRGKNVQLGWHAIEGMLYGAAVTAGGPPRPHTDFVNDDPTSRNARRGRLVAKLARILIEDLEIVANQWDADRTNSFAQKLVRGPLDESFKRALGGVADFSRKEMVDRKLGGILAGAPEVSDASNSTRADLAANALGIEGLLNAREGRVTAPSFIDLIRGDNAALADALVGSIAAARASIDRCPANLAAEVSSDAAKRQAAEGSRDAGLAIAGRMDEVLRHYGLAR
jgi:putative iron-regulated protein